MKWFWGLLIIIIGLFFLGVNFNWWTPEQISTLSNFWPLILIFLGVALIFRAWRFGWVIILLILLLILLFIYDALRPGSKVNPPLRPQNQVQTTAINVDLPSGLSRAEVHVSTGAIAFKIDGNTDKLLSGELQSSFLEPKVTTTVQDNVARVDISTDKISHSWGRGKNELTLHLSQAVPLELDVDAGAASLDFDLSSVQLTKLAVKAGASSIKLTLGEKIQNNAAVNIDAGASSIEVGIPKSIGARAKVESGLTSRNFEHFNKIDNTTYQSENYDTAAQKIDLNFKTGASSIKINTI